MLTLDLPERRNAMTPELTAAWAEAVAGLGAERSLRCVVVTGAGPAFCSGGDTAWIAEQAQQGAGRSGAAGVDAVRARMLPFYRSWLSLRELEVPTVAAVNGPAVGAGLALALACDLRYATPEASFSAPFTALGLAPGMGTTWLLPQVVGPAAARDLLLTGRAVSGEEALALGLVSRLLPAETLLSTTVGVATTIASRAPLATRLTRRALADGGPASLADALAAEGVTQPLSMHSADLQEGLAAARERRLPRFSGE